MRIETVNHGGDAGPSISYNNGVNGGARLPVGSTSQLHRALPVVMGTGV
jgi:hypothetical protein